MSAAYRLPITLLPEMGSATIVINSSHWRNIRGDQWQ